MESDPLDASTGASKVNLPSDARRYLEEIEKTASHLRLAVDSDVRIPVHVRNAACIAIAGVVADVRKAVYAEWAGK